MSLNSTKTAAFSMRDSNTFRNPFRELYCFLISPVLICTFNCFLLISCYTAIIIIFVAVAVSVYAFLAYNKVVNRTSFLASWGYGSISRSWLNELPRVFDSIGDYRAHPEKHRTGLLRRPWVYTSRGRGSLWHPPPKKVWNCTLWNIIRDL